VAIAEVCKDIFEDNREEAIKTSLQYMRQEAKEVHQKTNEYPLSG
jgi:hypothetical protein